jgi:putative acetyltransferase
MGYQDHCARLEGLYTDPNFSGRGIGTELLNKLEIRMRTQGIRTIRAEAGLNAEGFYLRRGYEPLGPPLGMGGKSSSDWSS